MSKVKIIPDLRFPEFENEGEWDKPKLSSVSDVIMGSSPSSLSYNENKIGLPLLQGNADIKNRLSTPRIYTTEITKECEIGDILLSVRAPVGTVAKSLHNACIGRGISALSAKKPNSQEYIYQWLFSYESSWAKISQGGTFDAVNSDDIKNLLVPIPKPKEQQKIASCLSSLDALITAQSEKIEQLKLHKKGLMQNLFPQKGEKVPKYRFMEFENDGEWVKTKLGDSAIFINGRAYKQEELLETGKYRVLRVGNFFTNNNWYYSDLELEENKYCEDGDLLYAWSASFGPRVWRGEKVIYHYHIWKLLPSESISNDFLFVLLDNETERMKTQNANGFALLHITKSTIENWECKIPKSKIEQEKIASCLSSLDAFITSQAEKIEQLKLHKKGLMQGLFPKIKS